MEETRVVTELMIAMNRVMIKIILHVHLKQTKLPKLLKSTSRFPAKVTLFKETCHQLLILSFRMTRNVGYDNHSIVSSTININKKTRSLFILQIQLLLNNLR